MALTAQEIEDIRADIGDTGASEAFTDDEIQRAYDRCVNAPDQNTRDSATRGLLVRQLLASAAKLNDYSAGATSEKRSQIFAQLEKLFEMYRKALESALNTEPRGTARVNIKNVPRVGRTYPGDYEVD